MIKFFIFICVLHVCYGQLILEKVFDDLSCTTNSPIAVVNQPTPQECADEAFSLYGTTNFFTFRDGTCFVYDACDNPTSESGTTIYYYKPFTCGECLNGSTCNVAQTACICEYPLHGQLCDKTVDCAC